MKRYVISLALAAGITATAGSAVAAPPKPIDPALLAVYANACVVDGLPTLEGSLSGKTKEIDTPGGKIIAIAPGAKITLTNPDNLKTVSYVITGSFHASTDAAGNTVVEVRGRNLLTRTAEPGLYLTVGNVFFVAAPDGTFPVEFALDGPGRVVNVCDVLS